MYNVGAIYEIIGRVVNGTSVPAYMLKDRRNNQARAVEKTIVEQLALNKQIYNCTGQIYNNIVNLKGINCKLSKLPKYDIHGKLIPECENITQTKKVGDLQLIGKIQDGRVIKAYVVCAVSDESKRKIISRDKVLSLAQSGRIINAKSQRNGNEIVLRGNNGFNLSQLQIYNE